MPFNETDSSGRKLDLRTLSHDRLVALVTELGQPAFRAKQVEDWVWKKHGGF